MRSFSLAVLIAVAAATPAAAIDRELGTAVQANIAAMTVDLNPEYANTKMEGTTGILSATAVGRYRAGQVKPLLRLDGRSDLGTAAVTGNASESRGNTGTGPSQQTGPR